ncbi:SHOCT domain-containing protein [Alkaliphilus sp. MSJ-5]|uniref:SHOCT domain-containing protein n=1 Tax=Alkaliphilus flagellatus TaxID=2841507 RepID=A0ABS6G0U4_9FIRM|nr:SHOCT domain-containing protein [Alkaliphilus flagellatus]MBU5676120.1 SHOCT domain-containing protein [Alkaliphilus flagellatus]
MNWKKSIIPATLSLTLLIPTAAFADNNANVSENTKGFGGLRTVITNRSSHENEVFYSNIEVTEEVKIKLEELKAKLDSGEITKEQFREEMKQLMPERSQFKGVEKKLIEKIEIPEEVKVKLEELKAKLDSGEITKEQFREEMKELMPEGSRHERIAISEEVKTKLQELRTKLENGEITEDQFHEEMKELIPEGFRVKIQRKDSSNKEISSLI